MYIKYYTVYHVSYPNNTFFEVHNYSDNVETLPRGMALSHPHKSNDRFQK